uniref:Uncharacterized protein n=1 Tax=Setaria viridis TaxID=4556 RepID=A0A4U6VLE1_SETVI|nr:hypothetical protein SEVIR_3G096933v2 [Setaria viridis]
MIFHFIVHSIILICHFVQMDRNPCSYWPMRETDTIPIQSLLPRIRSTRKR